MKIFRKKLICSFLKKKNIYTLQNKTNQIMSNITHYALWYYWKDGEKSANAISMDPDSLLELHHRSVADPECYYHNYKKSIRKISVEPIECFYYSKDTGKMERLYSFYNASNATTTSLYATYQYSLSNELKEVVVALSPEEYIPFSKGKGDLSLSNNAVQMDTYYAEGIMNA